MLKTCERCRIAFDAVKHSRRFCSKRCAKIGQSRPDMKGERNPNWKGGTSPRDPYVEVWRRLVFERDCWTCQRCGARAGRGKAILLNAHHIKPWAKHPELRFSLDNGITLCVACHCLEHGFNYPSPRRTRPRRKKGMTPQERRASKTRWQREHRHQKAEAMRSNRTLYQLFLDGKL
jgi:hypothetical protein